MGKSTTYIVHKTCHIDHGGIGEEIQQQTNYLESLYRISRTYKYIAAICPYVYLVYKIRTPNKTKIIASTQFLIRG